MTKLNLLKPKFKPGTLYLKELVAPMGNMEIPRITRIDREIGRKFEMYVWDIATKEAKGEPLTKPEIAVLKMLKSNREEFDCEEDDD